MDEGNSILKICFQILHWTGARFLLQFGIEPSDIGSDLLLKTKRIKRINENGQ
jgi:hypothetical protein